MLKNLALGLLTSFLLCFSSLGYQWDFLAAIAFVPLLLVESRLSRNWRGDLQWIVFGFLSLTSWLLVLCFGHGREVSMGLENLFLYTVLFTGVLGLFRFVKSRLGSQRGYIALPFLWISMEALLAYWHQDSPPIVQHQGFAYVLSIWVFNILLAGALYAFVSGQRPLAYRWWAALGLAFAVAIGLYFSQLSLSRLLPDLLMKRLSYFMAGFLLLYALVRGYLQRQNTQV